MMMHDDAMNCFFSAQRSGCVPLRLAICERTVIEWRFYFIRLVVYDTGSTGGPQPPICLRPPICFFARLDSFKYSARICRMAMRFVRGRFEKHLRVPFLHTL
jgi:hypothetical protein